MLNYVSSIERGSNRYPWRSYRFYPIEPSVANSASQQYPLTTHEALESDEGKTVTNRKPNPAICPLSFRGIFSWRIFSIILHQNPSVPPPVEYSTKCQKQVSKQPPHIFPFVQRWSTFGRALNHFAIPEPNSSGYVPRSHP